MRFTENGQVLAVGKGLWATATPTAFEQAYFEAAVYWGAGSEDGRQAILTVRLKVNEDWG